MKDICFTPIPLLENNEVVRILQLTANSMDSTSYVSTSRFDTRNKAGQSASDWMNFEKCFILSGPANISQPINDFEEIVQNTHLAPIEKDVMEKCQCQSTDLCSVSCLNRATRIECNEQQCPCGTLCTNNRIQRRNYARVEKFNAGTKGWGVRPMEIIKKGSFIVEYVGEVCRVDAIPPTEKDNVYFLSIDSNLLINARNKGNIARNVNHSCEPNAEIQKWHVDGLPRMIISAKQDIFPGDEITFDYQFKFFDAKNEKVCLFESRKCRGHIGVKIRKTDHSETNPRILKQKNQLVQAIAADNGSKSFACHLCGVNFTKLGSLKRHRQRQHDKDLHFICFECNKSFLHHDNLVQHEKLHQKIVDVRKKAKQIERKTKPKCNACGATFTKNTSLLRHMKSNACK